MTGEFSFAILQMERGTASGRSTSSSVQTRTVQTFSGSAGRSVFLRSHYHNADDCKNNHQEFKFTHGNHLLLHLSKNREVTPPDIRLRIREVEPSTVSRQCHLHHCTYITTYQEFSPVLVLLGLNTCHRRHNLYTCYKCYNCYNLYRLATDSTTLTLSA